MIAICSSYIDPTLTRLYFPKPGRLKTMRSLSRSTLPKYSGHVIKIQRRYGPKVIALGVCMYIWVITYWESQDLVVLSSPPTAIMPESTSDRPLETSQAGLKSCDIPNLLYRMPGLAGDTDNVPFRPMESISRCTHNVL